MRDGEQTLVAGDRRRKLRCVGPRQRVLVLCDITLRGCKIAFLVLRGHLTFDDTFTIPPRLGWTRIPISSHKPRVG
jgi:hypothetical protein